MTRTPTPVPWPEYVAGNRPYVRSDLTRRVPTTVVDDLTQDTLIKALRFPPPHRGPENLGWLRTIARNLAADWWRDTRRRWHPLPDREDPVPFDAALEHRDDFLRRLACLEPRQQRALWLRAAGYTAAEIGGEIGGDRKVVDLVVWRARRRIEREHRRAA